MTAYVSTVQYKANTASALAQNALRWKSCRLKSELRASSMHYFIVGSLLNNYTILL